MAGRIDDILNRLSPDHRNLLVLRDVQGLEPEAIAAKLELAVEEVRLQLREARAELRDLLYEKVRRLVADPLTAWEIVEKALFKAYASPRRFHGSRWLYQIALEVAQSYPRPAEQGGAPGLEVTTAFASALLHPANHEAERVQKALSQLCPEHKAVLVLKDMEEMKYEEIAEILGVPIGTVRSRLHRARQELRDILQKDGG